MDNSPPTPPVTKSGNATFVLVITLICLLLASIGYIIYTVVAKKADDSDEETEETEETATPAAATKPAATPAVATPAAAAAKPAAEATKPAVATPAPAESGPVYAVFLNTDYEGHDIKGIGFPPGAQVLDSCKNACDEIAECNAFVVDKEEKYQCFLKNLPSDAKPTYNKEWKTYYKGTPPTAGAAIVV